MLVDERNGGGRVSIGEAFADHSRRVSLAFSYPRRTPRVTKQACSIRGSGTDLAKAVVASVGVSPNVPKTAEALQR